jgi:hypothetical protein
MPSEEALNNETVMEDEKNELKYDYWCDGMTILLGRTLR